MLIETNKSSLNKEILSSKCILFIQDIDGVCIPLVKDPLARKLNQEYIFAANQLEEEFFVLTCGEHEGVRGVNRIIERTLKSTKYPKEKGLYLQGLAACGVEYQNNKGTISIEGISKKEINFLSNVPKMMRPKYELIVKRFFPEFNDYEIDYHAKKSICDTRFSPTINFNSLFELISKDCVKRRKLQENFEKMMYEIINQGIAQGLTDSFFLHISPNLGINDGKEIMKISTTSDIGSTDIQLLLKGAVKDAGVLCLLNKFVGNRTGRKPFGENFNFRDVPISTEAKIDFCKKYIKANEMPKIIGVGDTITSQFKKDKKKYLRGGSDRSFLEFIQLLGQAYGIDNRIVFVDSSSGEVCRPSTKKNGLEGITDKEDKLKFDVVFQNGPKEYIDWFIKIAKKRSEIRKKIKNN